VFGVPYSNLRKNRERDDGEGKKREKDWIRIF